ncbi:hypothetical protein [Shinella pollutisoli]|uniref:Uncharacterized protein n=1 Tax=Shinella pollutisoli TaxID=2250594 RepID=A0ABV7DKR4_9HYPH|nr:hypothetical protein [Shinella pollutisoli]
MGSQSHIQLHFDFLSCRALLSLEDGREYVLPDVYPNKEAAQAAAQKFAWEKLGLNGARGHAREPVELAIWLR